MASPQPTSYSVPSGRRLVAGRARYPNALLDLIAAAPPLSWIKANTNTLSSIFPPTDFAPMFGGGPGVPTAVIRAWSGFAWDSNHSRLIITGGGHANYSGNDVFVFDTFTRQWKLGYSPSDIKTNVSGLEAIDGPLKAPISSHTYSNNSYLPKLDRFQTFGGAAQSSGGGYLVTDGAGATLRQLPGGYTLDLSLAGQGHVAGTAGSNPHRFSSSSVNLPGANAWLPRDYLLDHPDRAGAMSTFAFKINGGTAYAEEGGFDVLYCRASNGGTSPDVFRVEYHDAVDYKLDVVSKVGRAWTNPGSDAGAALDVARKCFVYLVNPTTPVVFWDLNFASPTLNNTNVAAAGLTGTGAAELLGMAAGDYADFGLLHDSRRARFVMWSRGGAVFSLVPPAGSPIPATGWVAVKIADPATPRPMTASELGSLSGDLDTGVHGKWRMAPELDVYVGLQHNSNGDVWMFRPENWIDPRI